jgi:2-amino-4-hydroxy-6-hydroxymethyldihydropteridine diphosphokinase
VRAASRNRGSTCDSGVTPVLIGLGSNLGDLNANLDRAVTQLTQRPGLSLVRQSRRYETTPWGLSTQPNYLNAAIWVETTWPPHYFLGVLKAIEQELGRVPTEKWGARLIDLDILFFGDQVIEIPGLCIPHPQAHLRPFVLIPLLDIAPEWIHPQHHKTLRQLAAELPQNPGGQILGSPG